MKNIKAPKKFSWKIKTEPKPVVPGTVRFQEQCSSGQCCGKCN